jgi:F-type H+-transporting ATPase subunit delta
MAELATIARPYAEALFKSSQGDLARCRPGLSSWRRSPPTAVAAVRRQPQGHVPQVFDLVSGIVKGPLPEAAKNFLRTVIDNGRLACLPEIAAQFRGPCAMRRRLVGCRGLQRLPDRCRSPGRSGCHAGEAVRPQAQRLGAAGAALIGGIRVVVGDEVLDTSVKARLQQMKRP